MQPDEPARGVQRSGSQCIRWSEHKRGRVNKVPAGSVRSVDGEPHPEQRLWELLPSALQKHSQTARRGEIGRHGHDQADGYVPVGEPGVPRPNQQQDDSREQAEEFPRTHVLSSRVEVSHPCFIVSCSRRNEIQFPYRLHMLKLRRLVDCAVGRVCATVGHLPHS